MRYKILVIDDDPDNLSFVKALLEKEGCTVLVGKDGQEGLLAARDSKPDLALCDVAMPGMDGLAFCRELKADARTRGIPVLLMSGQRREVDEQVEGMEQGADDYLLKPFPPRLLVAKVQAVLRRYEAPKELGDALKAEGLAIDVNARTVTSKEGPIALTRKEFDLLTTLLRKRGHVLSVAYLLETVWGYDPAQYNDPATVQVHLSGLRKKLGERISKKIVTVPGLGYRFEAS